MKGIKENKLVEVISFTLVLFLMVFLFFTSRSTDWKIGLEGKIRL